MKTILLWGILLIGICSTSSLSAQDEEFVSPRFRQQPPPPVSAPPPPPTKDKAAPTDAKTAPEKAQEGQPDGKDKADKSKKDSNKDADSGAAKVDKDKSKKNNLYDEVKVEEKAPPTFTYNTERRYTVIHELDGEQFMPAQYQPGTNDVAPLYPGDVTITIGEQTIRFEGVKNLDELQILSKFVDRVGYIYELMDKKGQAARFKVVLDQDKYVNLLYFFSKALGEHTFFLAQKTEQDRATELNHFTPKSELFVRAYQNLINVEVNPYTMQKDFTVDDKPTVLKASDNISFKFDETSVATPQGTFSIKKANTYTYAMDGFPAVTAVVEIVTQGKPGKVSVFLNYKQQIEFIEVATSRYFLMP